MIDLKKLRASAEIHLHFNPGMTIPETILALIDIAEAAQEITKKRISFGGAADYDGVDKILIDQLVKKLKALSAVRGDSDEHP